MERLISKTTVSPRIHVPGRSPSLLTARRTASPAAGGSSSAAPWTAVRAQPPRLAAAAASPLRHDGLSASAPVDEVATAGLGPPWKLLGNLLPKVRRKFKIQFFPYPASNVRFSEIRESYDGSPPPWIPA
jgi:hypothetical protein